MKEKIKRYWREIKQPVLKCERVGHKKVKEYRGTYRKSYDWHSVAYSCKEEREICSRCGHIFLDWEVVSKSSLQGLTMDADEMQELDENGFVVK